MNAWILAAALLSQPLAQVQVESFTGDAQVEIGIRGDAALRYDSGSIDGTLAPGWTVEPSDGVALVDGDGDGRVDRIDVTAAGHRVRRYELGYEGARLVTVAVAGRTDADRLPPMRFGYDASDRLVRVDNGIGAVTTLRYEWGHVVERVAHTGSGAVTITEKYRYAEPTADQRGFGVVEMKRSDSVGTPPRYERRLFYRGETGRTYRVPERLASEPWPDDERLSGNPLAVLSGPSLDDLRHEAWSAWTVDDAGATQLVSHLEMHDGQSDLTDYAYDARGRLTRIDDHGASRYTTIRYEGDDVVEARTTSEPGGGQILELVRGSRAALDETDSDSEEIPGATWDPARGVSTRVERRYGTDIHCSYDGFGRLVRETAASGEVLREIEYTLHPSLPNRIRERTAYGTTTVFLDGWLRPLSTTFDDGTERVSTYVRYTHTGVVDRVARDWSPSQSVRLHFGPDDDGTHVGIERQVDWYGDVHTTFVVTDDAVWQLDFDESTNEGRIVLPDGRRFAIGADVEAIAIPTFDAGDCHSDPADAAEKLAAALLDVVPNQPDPRGFFDRDGNLIGVEIYNADGLVAVIDAGRDIGGEPHFLGVAAWNWAVRTLVGTSRNVTLDNPLSFPIGVRRRLGEGFDGVEHLLRLPYFDERARQAGEGIHPLGRGVQPLFDAATAIVVGSAAVEPHVEPATTRPKAPVDKWSREPRSIQDRLTLEAAKKGAGEEVPMELNDPRYRGMQKMEYKTKSADGKDSVVHYVRDPKTGETMDFKFKKHSTDDVGRWVQTREPKVPPTGPTE